MTGLFRILLDFKDENRLNRFREFLESKEVVYRWAEGSMSLTVVPIFPDSAAPASYKDICKKIVSRWFEESGIKTNVSYQKDSIGKGPLWRVSEDYLKKLDKKEEQNKEEKIELTPEITCTLTQEELVDVLGRTIKHDEVNKLITFYAMLLTYTEDSQVNVSYRAPSSTGKSYIPIEIAEFFPETDIVRIGYSSPTAFFHDTGEWDPELKGFRVNLERKIIIFLDQPHDHLLQRLRPLLSHDQKEILVKITDKQQKRGLKTKNIILRGFPSVIFCTGNLRIDEQEATRNFVLSPETNQEKIREAIVLKAFKKADPFTFKDTLKKDPKRENLRKRVLAIRQEAVNHVIIPEYEKIAQRFIEENKYLKPRHTRDISRLISLIQGHALLNMWDRKRDSEGNVIACEEDIELGFKLWGRVSESQELGLVPYIYRLYKEVIHPLAEANSYGGLTRKDIVSKHYDIYGRALPDWLLRREILPALESCGLVYLEADTNDKRRTLVFTPRPSSLYPERNRELEGRVTLQEYSNNEEPLPEGIPPHPNLIRAKSTGGEVTQL